MKKHPYEIMKQVLQKQGYIEITEGNFINPNNAKASRSLRQFRNKLKQAGVR